MENVSLSIVNLRANKETALAAHQIYLNKSPDFQRDYEAWDDKLRTRFIESIILNRATNPIWIVLNDEENSEEILDGMHRVTTALSFLKNEFCIMSSHLMTLDKEKYKKKFFNDLDLDDQAKVRSYNFIFNKLDSSYRKDMNKLKDMYAILNRSSKTLNDYEFNKVILRPFYNIVSKNKDAFIKTGFFNKVKDTRGNVDTDIIEILVLSYELPSCWSSVANMTDEWIKNEIGETSEEVDQFVAENGEDVENKLKLIIKMITDFYQKNAFSLDKRTFKKFYLIYKFIVSRCCHLVKDYALFNRISPVIIQRFITEMFVDKFLTSLNCSSRNAVFQKKVIEKIDEIILAEINQEGTARRFSKKTILEKLAQQKNICPLCNLLIKECDDYDGDHIIPWTAGGKTVPDNLQILHKRCHQLK